MFEATHFVAWIIDDAVAKTRPLPKTKKVLDLPKNPLLDDSVENLPQDELKPVIEPEEKPPVNRNATSLWVSELRDTLIDEFSFSHVTESIYSTVTELVQT